MLKSFRLLLAALTAVAFPVQAQVIINEIHYHPIEESAFNADGTPFLDLTDDVHEFVEIRNTGASAVDLSGWQVSDAVSYTFPAGTSIPAGGYKVIAKNPTRLQTVYAIGGVLGPYSGVLGNGGESVKLRDSGGTIVDSVSYSSSFPWAGAADAMGAGSALYGFSFYPYQYKGRSLERVSATANSNDPANWLASPLATGPTPGRANTVTRTDPKPVVIAYTALQSADDSPTIRASQTVRVDVTFSSSLTLSNVQLEWFLDDVNLTSEAHSFIAMTSQGNNRWTTAPSTIPGQVDRSIVRWRILANRGDGNEVVFPRADDPQFAPIGAGGAREAWNGYFVEPVRTSTRPIYDFFISTANASILDSNIAQSPRRVLSTGYPRDDPKDGYYPPNANYNPVNYPAAGAPHWDGVVPAVFVRNGIVYDVTARYHGSRYNRNSSSWKLAFPSSKLMDKKQRIILANKGSANVVGYALFHEAGLPAGYSQFIDFYKNTDALTQRCEITDSDEETVAQYQREIKAANPQNPPTFDGLGIIYKAKGLDGDEGPYGWANDQPLPATGVWSSLDRYIHSYPSQLNDWRGCVPLKTMIDGVWAARGDANLLVYNSTYNGTNHANQANVPANIANLRTYLAANWDVEKMLTYLAIRNWCSPWDDKFHNHYFYLQPDNKWTMLPWDFDSEMAGGATGTAGYTNSIFAGRKDDLSGTYANNTRGPSWGKDHFLRAYETEFKQRLFILNNTLLAPANVQAIAAAHNTTVPDTAWLTNRQIAVNNQCGFGAWTAPNQPTNTSPVSNTGVVPPGNLTTSAYTHSSGSTAGLNAHAKTRWEIRRSDSTYTAPVYNVTSTTSLTSLPIPFAELEFGRTYFWRTTYYDGNDHPSTASVETSFSFGPPPGNATLISFSDVWKYNYTITPTDNTWAQPGFDDSAWASGQGTLAFENQGSIPETIRTTLPDPKSLSPIDRAYYFRKTFTFPGNPATATIRIRHVIDDGCVIWINGQRIHRYLMNNQANYAYSDFSAGTPAPSGEAVYQFADALTGATNEWIDPRPYLVQGTNTIAVEVHQVNTSSTDIVMGLEMTATLVTTGGDIALNEVLADNRSLVNGANKPDYVEIRNNTAATISLSGWSLTDNVLNPGKYNFPAGTSVPAGGRLVVYCDNELADPGLHSGFALSRDGQTVVLCQGSNVRDFVTFGPQAPDVAIGRVSDGIGAWTAVTPSPGATNVAATLGAATTLKVNEWMATPNTGEDYFEIYNSGANPVSLAGLWLSDTVGSAITQIPALSFIGAKGFTRFDADGSNNGGNHANFKLSTSGDNVILLASNGTTVLDSVSFGSQAAGVSQGRLPDGGATIVSFSGTPSPGESNWVQSIIVVNEALTNSVAPLTDYIELLNTSGASVDISGWWLSDDRSQLQKYQIPAGTVLPAGGYVVFNEGQFNTGANAFSLSSLGDEIVLSAVTGGTLNGTRAQVSFGAAADNVSFGRVVVGGGTDFWAQTARTPGTANAAPVTAPVILNEIHYHPPDLAGADNTRDEFIELHNITTSPVNLDGWRLKNDADFTFAAGTTLRPGDYILVVGFDPAADPASLAAFRTALSVPAGTPIYGPFTPKLSNSSAVLELAFPGTPVGSTIPYVLADKVGFFDTSPWPVAADGSGSSLQRQSRTVIGNDYTNWIAATPNPGALNYGQPAILDNDGDGMANTWEEQYGLDKFSAADAAIDTDGDGQSNAAEFAAGTSPTNPADKLSAQTANAGGGQMKVIFAAKAGKTYTIQYKDALTDAQWQRLVDVPAPASDGPIERTDPATGMTKRFYRVVTPQIP